MIEPRTEVSVRRALSLPILLTLLATGLPAAASQTTAAAPPAPLAETAIELDRGIIELEVTIAGKGTMRAVLDTGASRSILGIEAAEKLGIELADAPGVRAVGAGGPVEVKWIGEPLAFGIGGTEVRIEGMAALPLAPLLQRSGREWGAILGAEVFAQYTVEVDYAAKRLALYEPGTWTPKPGGAVLSFDRHHGKPVIPVDLTTADGRRVTGRFKIDSGAAATLIAAPHFADRHQLLPAETLVVPRHGAGREMEHLAARVKALEVAGFSLRQPVIEVPVVAAGPFAEEDTDGVIGAEVLRRFTVVYEYHEDRVTLYPNDALSEEVAFVGSGLTLLEGEADGVRVHHVVSPSPGEEAGIEVGDELLEVDGVAVAELAFSELRQGFEVAGRTLTLVLARGGERYETRVTPRSLL